MTWFEKSILHISRFVPSFWTHLRCFHRFSLSIKSYCRKTDGGLSWPEMTLATWLGVTGRNIRIQGVKYTCKPMIESVSNGFHPKEAPFNLLPDIMERSQNWWYPWVTDIQIPRYTFNRYCSGYQSLKVLRWSFSVAMTSIKTFFLRWCHLTWPGDLTLRSDLGLKLS